MQTDNLKPKHTLLIGALTGLLASTFSLTAHPSELTIPNQFSAGSPALASEVNGNFAATVSAVNNNFGLIEALQDATAALQAANLALEDRVAALELENTDMAEAIAFVSSLQQHVSVGLDAQLNPAVVFSGVNLHINNGDTAGETQSLNGLGNLVIGFNESFDTEISESLGYFCSGELGNVYPYSNQQNCESEEVDGTWTQKSEKTGSHNLVIGSGHSYTAHSGVVAGSYNVVTAPASAAFGQMNRAINNFSSVTGGNRNTASGEYSSVTGGLNNLASSFNASVTGGQVNRAEGDSSTVSGGASNIASDNGSVVTGGFGNSATGNFASVSGGLQNQAVNGYSSVSGGTGNTASGESASVSGGDGNTAIGTESSVSGGFNNLAEGFRTSISGGAEVTANGANQWRAGDYVSP